jgi:hypothetical protein
VLALLNKNGLVLCTTATLNPEVDFGRRIDKDQLDRHFRIHR